MPQEGATVRNRRTGETGIYRNGQVVPMQNGPIYSGSDPSDSIAAQNSQRQERRFQYEQQRDNVQDQRQAAEDIRTQRAYDNAQRDAAYNLEKVIRQIDDIEKDVTDGWGGWGETGMSGSLMSNVPGSAAYDLRAAIQTVDANSAFSALQKMRDASPTGGALGQVTERELDLLKSSVANLNPNQSQDQFLRALKTTRDYYTNMLGRVSGSTSGGNQRPADIDEIMRKYGAE